jgi:hypothetical protein
MSDPDMIETDPADLSGVDAEKLAACIDACFECAQACTACADACLLEKSVAELTACIRTNLDCADMCEATGRLLSRHSGQNQNLARAFVDTCAVACRTCAQECSQHADTFEHCRVCAEACQRCARACEELVASFG